MVIELKVWNVSRPNFVHFISMPVGTHLIWDGSNRHLYVKQWLKNTKQF